MTTPESVTQHYGAHLAHLQLAWEQAMFAEDFDSVIVHAGSPLVSFLDDFHYNFRPNPHFLAWLPLTAHPESVLIVRPGLKPVLYYYQPNDYWHLVPADPEPWWAEHFEIRVMREAGEWRQGVPVGREAYLGDTPELAGDDDVNPTRLLNRLHLIRTQKTAYEMACLRVSSDRAAVAHQAAAKAFEGGESEYGIHMAYLGAGELTEAELPYGSIVALNEHAAVLHYQKQSRSVPEEMRTFLIDAGATFHGYCSDITRTYSTDTGEFAELINSMNAMQLDSVAGMKAGVDYRDMHLDAHRAIAEVLVQHQLIHCSAEASVENGLSSAFFPHGLGHYLGLQTHDVAGLIADETGREIPRPKGHPFLRLTRQLEPGNVLTVEPGLYFIESLLMPWRTGRERDLVNWEKVDRLTPYGGIRIEDDVAITDGDPENLSRDAFAKLD